MEIDWDDWDYSSEWDNTGVWDDSQQKAMDDADNEALILQILAIQEDFKLELRSMIESSCKLREEISGDLCRGMSILDRSIERLDRTLESKYCSKQGSKEKIEGTKLNSQDPTDIADDTADEQSIAAENHTVVSLKIPLICSSDVKYVEAHTKCLVKCPYEPNPDIPTLSWVGCNSPSKDEVGQYMLSGKPNLTRMKELVGSDEVKIILFEPATHGLSSERIAAMSLMCCLTKVNAAITVMDFLGFTHAASLNLENVLMGVWFRGPNPGGTEKVSLLAHHGRSSIEEIESVAVSAQDGILLTIAMKMGYVMVLGWHCDSAERLCDGLYLESLLKNGKADMFIPVGYPPTSVDLHCSNSWVEDYVIGGECHDSTWMIFRILVQSMKEGNVSDKDGIGSNLGNAISKSSCYALHTIVVPVGEFNIDGIVDGNFIQVGSDASHAILQILSMFSFVNCR